MPGEEGVYGDIGGTSIKSLSYDKMFKTIQYSSFRKLVTLKQELKKRGYEVLWSGDFNLLRKEVQNILNCNYNRARTYLYTLLLLED